MVLIDLKQRISYLESLGAKKLSLPYKEIPEVISSRALEEHLKLYQGYKDLLKRVDSKFDSMEKSEFPKKHLPDHPFRVYKEAETFALGGIILHELFFNNLTPNPMEVKGSDIEKFIKRGFSSLAEWKSCMRGTIMEARGWVVFSVDSERESRILMLDAHNIGAMFYQEPLVVVDCYEHSYWMDHGVDRGNYADGILKHLNWEEINKRYLDV